jgi:hypothetical protein
MRSNRKILLISILLLASMLLSNTALAERPVIAEEKVLWELSRVTVVNPGESIEMPEGILIRGIVIEAKAKAKGVNQVPEGNFTLTLDAFWPRENLPAQDAGYWYIQGSWSLSKKGASLESLKARHNPDVLKGHIKAQTMINPLESNRPWSALVTVPMSPGLGRWNKGEGSLSFDSPSTGSLYLDLSRWPEVR